jgi:hypothetical protein
MLLYKKEEFCIMNIEQSIQNLLQLQDENSDEFESFIASLDNNALFQLSKFTSKLENNVRKDIFCRSCDIGDNLREQNRLAVGGIKRF